MPYFSSKHFWPTLYACKYLGLGIAAFALPTTTWYEITIRIIFIWLGIHTIATLNRPGHTKIILAVAAIILSFWVVFATGIIFTIWPSLYARLLVFTLPFWLGWIVGHIRVIGRIDAER